LNNPHLFTAVPRFEQEDLLSRFVDELSKVTADGGRKRAKGKKSPWYIDDEHEGAFFRHIAAVKSGELMDSDSGAHHYIHAAWRLLALACIDIGNIPKIPDDGL
jgi:hypothetical protein